MNSEIITVLNSGDFQKYSSQLYLRGVQTEYCYHFRIF